jgi:predicted lipoprotein with Yx(FWY)xxD motif
MSIPLFSPRRSVPAVLIVFALAAAACSSGGGASAAPSSAAAAASPSAAAASPSASATESASPTESAEAEYKIEIADNATLGKILTGEEGKTLYIFKADTKPNESVCTGECAVNWPPYALEGNEKAEAGEGVTGTIATFDRADGTKQVSYNGMPLYYFKGDAKAGDINGQGLADGKWVAATP